MNLFAFTGWVTKDPEDDMVTGKLRVRFAVSVPHPWKKHEPSSLLCEAWAKKAEFIRKYIKKGDSVWGQGYITIRKHDGENYVTRCNITDFGGLGNHRAEDGEEEAPF